MAPIAKTITKKSTGSVIELLQCAEDDVAHEVAAVRYAEYSSDSV